MEITATSKHLIQLLLPVADNKGHAFPSAIWEGLKDALTKQFGGVTTYTRAPAQGVWAPAGGVQRREDVFIVEVIADQLDLIWWDALRRGLEDTLGQEQIIVRALPMIPL